MTCADSSLAMFKVVGYSSRVTPSLVRLHRHVGFTPRVGTHGVNPRVPLGLESHLRLVRHEWLYRIAQRIIETHKLYHNDYVGSQLAGQLVRCGYICKPLS